MAKKKKGRRTPKKKTSIELPDRVFKPLVRRLDGWISYWKTKWPHGVNPERCTDPTLHQMGPVSRAYKAGVRAESLFQEMDKIEKALRIPGVDIDRWIEEQEEKKAAVIDETGPYPEEA